MKNPHAVALGRKGGKKGGKARMASMTAAQRRAFARKGGKARQAALRAARQELLNKMHDGRWAVERTPPFLRVDWENRAQDRSLGLFGPAFYFSRMRERMREHFRGRSA